MAVQDSAAPQSVKDLRILLVEDDSATRTLLARMLEDLSVHGVTPANDGVHALECLRNDPEAFDLLICDLEMPRLGGLDLLHALRTLRGSPLSSLPAVVLTSHRQADIVQRAIAYGISGYLVKPITKADLAKRLSFAIQRKR